jgi:hypothetical protein
LQKVNPEFFRVRHYVGKHLSKNGNEVSTFRYCKVETEWALQEIAKEEELNKWYLRKR